MRKYASGNKLNLNILSFFQLCIWDPLYIFEDFEAVWEQFKSNSRDIFFQYTYLSKDILSVQYQSCITEY